MDQELKQYLDTNFGDVNRRLDEVNGHFAEVDRRFADVNRRFDEVNARFADVDRRFDEEREAVRQIETNLLSAFHTWARTYEVRSRSVSSAVVGFDERLALIEERLAEVERRTFPRAS
jgi:hypothetical protein